MNSNKKLNEGIRVAKEGIEECWDDMEGQGMTPEQGEQMSVTISMPGKNISVTTNSADEIGNILRLAGITVGAEPTPEVPAEMPGMSMAPSAEEEPIVFVGAQSMADSGNEQSMESPLTDNPGMSTNSGNSGDSGNSGGENNSGGNSGDGDSGEEKTAEATQTPKSWTDSQGNQHPGTAVQGKSYGNQNNSGEEKEKEVEEAKKPDADHDGVPDWADKHEGEDDADFKESADILRLAGVTEAQSAAQKAAFKAMIAKKNGGNSGKENSGEEKEEEVEESTAETPASNSVVGQGVYEGEMKELMWKDAERMSREQFCSKWGDEHGEFWDNIMGDLDEGANAAARIIALSGIEESKLMNSPAGTSMDEPTVYDKLPSKVGSGAGHKDYGQNRANNQGENPMGMHTSDVDSVEEAFQTAMGEYRKFVSEKIQKK